MAAETLSGQELPHLIAESPKVNENPSRLEKREGSSIQNNKTMEEMLKEPASQTYSAEGKIASVLPGFSTERNLSRGPSSTLDVRHELNFSRNNFATEDRTPTFFEMGTMENGFRDHRSTFDGNPISIFPGEEFSLQQLRAKLAEKELQVSALQAEIARCMKGKIEAEVRLQEHLHQVR